MDQIRAHTNEIQQWRMKESTELWDFSNIVPALQNAITNKALFHQRERYTIFQTTLNTPRHDDILYIADLHNAYHQIPDSITNKVRRQMAHLNIYVKDVTKRDFTKLIKYFIRWINMDYRRQEMPNSQIDVWSNRQKDWRNEM